MKLFELYVTNFYNQTIIFFENKIKREDKCNSNDILIVYSKITVVGISRLLVNLLVLDFVVVCKSCQ
jgi:hypothetical protein